MILQTFLYLYVIYLGPSNKVTMIKYDLKMVLKFKTNEKQHI